MSIHIRVSGLANRTSLPLALVALAGFFCSSMKAQTAPQLLPYSVKVIAGGGTTALPLTVAPGACAPSGNTPTTVYGDGCLATDLVLSATSGARTAVTDAQGNVFFADYANGLIRRVDAATGIITTVAGGVAYTASPSTTGGIAGAPTTCPSSGNAPTDVKGDGCLGTEVFLSAPIGLAFSPAGDLYFSELGASTAAFEKIFGADVRKIAATSGVITGTGVITTADGALSSYYTSGYTVNASTCTLTVSTGCINAATQSYLGDPYGIAFDSLGNLYIAEEYKEAILVVNTNATGSTTVAGVTIPAGTVAKIAGYSATGGSSCPNGSTSASGCTLGVFTNYASANSSEIHYPYGLSVDPSGNVLFANYYNYDVAEISSKATSASWATAAGEIDNFAGEQSTGGANSAPITTRAVAGTFAIGDPHGVAADSNGNVYITDSNTGVIWRVDGTTNNMYVVAGGASAVCTTSIIPGVTVDSYGDGCPATSAKFGVHTGATGIFGVSVDANANLFVGDTLVPLIREVTSGTQFGPIADTPNPSANQATQYVEIHFAPGDTPVSSASDAYMLTGAGASNFTLGTAVCTTHSTTDNTTDCVLPITATPTTLGAYSGTLQVTANVGGAASFPLSGTFVQSPQTRTVVSASQAVSCTSTNAYSTSTQVTLTATITSSGPVSNSSTVTFYANNGTQNTQIGSTQTVDNNVATLTYTFSTAGNYAITAVFSGDSFYETSTSLPLNITSAVPSLGATVNTTQLNTVNPGQTALYSFNLAENVYSGNISFACSGGLPANSSCVFNPPSISASGCQTSSNVALSILTQQPPQAASLSGAGRGPWRALGIFFSFALALLIGVRRRSISQRYGRVWMALALLLATVGITSCNNLSLQTPATPAGTYNVSVTATGSGGVTYSFTVPLTVQ